MLHQHFQEEWEAYRARAGTVEELRVLAEQVALSFLDRYYYADRFERDLAQLLCEMATRNADEARNSAGARALFGTVVETLCDDFEEMPTAAYNRLMCVILTYCRELPAGRELDRALRECGLDDFEALLARAERLRERTHEPRPLPNALEKILFLSRVTIGADVAVTSVLIERFARLYPQAQLVLLGHPKLAGLFGGHPRLTIRPVTYVRRGGLLERLHYWLGVREAVNAERAGLNHQELLVVDPDSRLSQLGVLPLVDDRHYLFLNSRNVPAAWARLSISEIADAWVTQVTGHTDSCHRQLWLPSDSRERAARWVGALRAAGAARVVVVNWGVGGNARKRVPGEFEEEALAEVLREPGTVVVLDRGAGDEEAQRATALAVAMTARGLPHAECRAPEFAPCRLSSGLVVLDAGIGDMAAVIAASDEYLGYDSAGQHIAAALGVPTCTVFAGSNNKRFVRRWRPCGPGPCELVHVDTLTHPPTYEPAVLRLRLRAARQALRGQSI